jgi:hypothetical protein
MFLRGIGSSFSLGKKSVHMVRKPFSLGVPHGHYPELPTRLGSKRT